MINNFMDLINKKFGKLVVIKQLKSQNRKGAGKQRLWLCKCDCGKTKELITSRLTSGTKSCGCSKRGKLKKGESGLNKLYRSYIRRSNIKGIKFNINKKLFTKLVQSKCYYCSDSPNQIMYNKTPTHTKDGIEYSKFIYNGLDRVDNNKGYIKNNVVPCCKHCNSMKMTLSTKEFINKIKIILKNLEYK